jgi:hypothetical protein
MDRAGASSLGPSLCPYSPECVERLSGKSLCGSDRVSFGDARRRKGAHWPCSADSWDPVMEPIRSFQTVSGREFCEVRLKDSHMADVLAAVA